ncbi:MAG: tetratricopeptide repeat protein [Erysipelotrichia bacterium]|nr:polysaccharide deacetylase family protein [Candidatus Riflebacteria bacterium]NCB39763.1 tetratricopeptide repeat protein [Erysipelotrichia bacterium]
MNRFFTLLFCILLLHGTCTHAAVKNFDNNNPPDLMRDFELLRKRIKLNPRDVAALNSLGIIYARASKLNDAIKLWQYALNVDPAYIHLYNNLGSAFKQMGRREEARIVFKTGLTHSSSYWIHYNLGLLEKEEGNVAAAVSCFKSCVAQNPGFEPAIKQLSELGYHSELSAKNHHTKFLSLGSYKPPVETGNIDFYPLLPESMQQQNSSTAPSSKRQPSKNHSVTVKKKQEKPFKPLSLSECDEIVKAFNAPQKDRYLAITFDDGPHHTYTREILDILKSEGAKATFFVVGSRAETYPDLITRMNNEGHDVGNHSWEHRSLAKSTTSDALTSLRRTNELISGITAKPCILVRPPFGHTSARVKNMLHQESWHEIMWDSDSRDWQNKNPDVILYRVMKSVGPGSIVLFHDIHPGAAMMLPTMLRAFKANGYRFITISDLIALTNAS